MTHPGNTGVALKISHCRMGRVCVSPLLRTESVVIQLKRNIDGVSRNMAAQGLEAFWVFLKQGFIFGFFRSSWTQISKEIASLLSSMHNGSWFTLLDPTLLGYEVTLKERAL